MTRTRERSGSDTWASGSAPRPPPDRAARDVTRIGPREDAVQASAPGLARLLGLLPLLHRARPPSARFRSPDRAGPDAPRLRAAGWRLDQVGPDARPALRPAPDRLLRRAVQAAQSGRAVLLRRGPRDHPQRARRRARDGLPVVQHRVVRGRVDRPGPPRGPAQRRAGRGQGPATGHPGDAPGGHPPDVRDDLAARLDAPVRRRRAAATSSTSSRAGPPTSSTTSSRRARPSSSTSTPRATRTSGSPGSIATTRRRAS